MNSWFVDRGTKTTSRLQGGHQVPEDITASLRKKSTTMCHVS